MSRTCFTVRLFFVFFISAEEVRKMAEKTVSNLVVRVFLDASEEVLGQNGLKAVLNYGGISDLLANRPDCSFTKDFTDEQLSALTSSYISIMGTDGARSLLRMIGKTLGKKTISMGIFDSFKDLPPDEKLYKVIELNAMASGRGALSRNGGIVVYDNPQCTTCAGVKYDQPICNLNTGFIESIIQWCGITDRRVVETECIAMGDTSCRFEILSVD
jgi:predicted hydrocarbon binding protein